MSKSLCTNTNRRNQGRLAVALIAGSIVAGCGDSGSGDPWHVDPEGYDGIGEETFPLLQDPCSISANTTTMTLQVRGGETLYLTLRAADSMVVADAKVGGAECVVPSTYKIAITEDGAHTGTEKVFLDYINGPFSLGATVSQVAVPGITLALGAGSSMVVRGSSGIDKIYLGSTYGANSGPLAASWINVNGDTSPDVRMTGVTDVKVSTGVGADIISADGGNGTTGVALDSTITFSAYGGPDADTLTGGKGPSTLDGGDGDDKFVQTATIGPDNIVGGKGVDTVDYSARLTAVNVTVCTTCSLDPGGCVAAHTTCTTTADTAQTTCTTTADTAQTTCHTTADTAQTTCHTTADTAQTTCHTTADTAKTACDGTANSDHGTCVAACAGDSTCTDACDAQLVVDLAACVTTQTGAITACDGTHTGAITACDGTHTGAITTCDSTHTTATTTCTGTHTSAITTCDTTEGTCQAAAGMPFCSVCTGDDGTGSEGDTVNDDVEIVLGGKGSDTISAFWAPCSDQAATPTIRCTLKGNDGDDTLIGSSHADTLDGGNGNDTLQPGLGDDTLIGGAGIDTVSYADRSNAVFVSLDASRLWVTGQNGEVGENDTIGADIENLTGGAGNDKLRGNSSANIIRGGSGNDTIEGAGGNDALYGELGNDLLYGGAGNDLLVGGDGTDTLVGGDGDDFIDATDSSPTSDTVIDCDGVNDSAGTAGTAPGTADALVKDGGLGIDSGALRCEL
jgi:Ca2+-binding RTX toxin-like protein